MSIGDHVPSTTSGRDRPARPFSARAAAASTVTVSTPVWAPAPSLLYQTKLPSP